MKNSESVDEKKRPELRHYTSFSVQRMHEKRNTLTGHFRNYASVSEIPTHRMEIQTAKSTKPVDGCLTAFSLHLLHTKINNLEKGNQVGKFKPCIKRLHIN